MRLLTIPIFLLFIISISVSCGSYSESDTQMNLNENTKSFMLPMAQVEEFEPNIQPLEKCWAEGGGKCCYAAGGYASCTDLGGPSCEGSTTGSAEGAEDCAALADEYAEAQD